MGSIFTSRSFKILICGLNLIFCALVSHANATCFKPQPSESKVSRSTVLAESISDLEVEYKKLLNSGQRLNGRFYWSELLNSYVADRPHGPLRIPDHFITSLTLHIETALERGYADFLFYPDMGHAHILLPYDEATGAPTSEEELLNSSELKVLFHTGELLRMRSGSVHSGPVSSDPWLAWRYHTRNFIGRMDSRPEVAILFGGADGGYNTVRSLEGHREYSRIYLSASHEGCFEAQVKGKAISFDISFDNFNAPPSKFSFLR